MISLCKHLKGSVGPRGRPSGGQYFIKDNDGYSFEEAG